jgi:hypothetical protein
MGHGHVYRFTNLSTILALFYAVKQTNETIKAVFQKPIFLSHLSHLQKLIRDPRT